MANAAKKLSADPKIRAIVEQQKQIEKYIRNVLFDLARIESGELPDFWVSIRNTSKFTTRRAELERRLAMLRRHLKTLRRQRSEVRLELMRQHSRKVRKRNRTAARRILRKAEKRGELTADEERKLIKHTQDSLQTGLDLVRKHPSRANIKDALAALGDFMLVGGSEGGSKRALEVLGDASERRYRMREAHFRKNPDLKNFKAMLQAFAESQMFGRGEPGALMNSAGLNVNWPEKSHRVVKGESLSSLSIRYYGSPAYWDRIYLANVGVIGDRPRQLRPDTVLRIPGFRN